MDKRAWEEVKRQLVEASLRLGWTVRFITHPKSRAKWYGKGGK